MLQPEGFYHATINIGDTIAVAQQKKQPVLVAEKLTYLGLSTLVQACCHVAVMLMIMTMIVMILKMVINDDNNYDIENDD